MDWSEITLPPLTVGYIQPLRSAMEYIRAEFTPFAVIATGSIVRGNPDPASDFDLVVLHNKPWRRRVQRFFDGVPSEIFVNSPAWMRRYFAEEQGDGRPIMAHMLTSGFVMYSSSEETSALIAEAQASLDRGAHFSEFALRQRRYTAACLFEDAFELATRDKATSSLILARAIEATVSYWFASRQCFTVRPKEQLHVIRAEDPETAVLIQVCLLQDGSPKLLAAKHLALRIFGATGFFEWDSGPSES